jgi:hypothetical protein
MMIPLSYFNCKQNLFIYLLSFQTVEPTVWERLLDAVSVLLVSFGATDNWQIVKL